MRTVDVYLDNRLAGRLTERSRDDYEFSYNVHYLVDQGTPAIALSLPKREEPYRSSRIFPFFTNLLPEGSNRKTMCAKFKVEDNDFFGMLEMICGMDCIGNVTLRKEGK